MSQKKLNRDEIDQRIVAIFDKVGIKPASPGYEAFWNAVDEVRKAGYTQEARWLARYGNMWYVGASNIQKTKHPE